MSDEIIFDALELARRANPEIDDMRRMAREPVEAPQPAATARDKAIAMALRAFRALGKGG